MLRIIPLLLLTAALCTACIPAAEEKKATASNEKNFVVVDTARVFRDSEPGKAGVEFLKDIQGDMQIELATLQAKLQADPENPALQQEAQVVFSQFQQRMNAEEQNVVNILNDLVQRILDDYRATKKHALILGTESALSYDKAMDVTDEIIAAINKQKITYKSIVPQESAEPQKSEAEKPAAPEAAKEAGKEADKAPEAAPAGAETPADKK